MPPLCPRPPTPLSLSLPPFPCAPGLQGDGGCCAVTSAKHSLTGDAAHGAGPQGLELLEVHVAVHLRRGGERGGGRGGSGERRRRRRRHVCVASVSGSNGLVGAACLPLERCQLDVAVHVSVFGAGGRGGGGKARQLSRQPGE